MVVLGLLLFFGRFYWLRIYLNRAFEWLGLACTEGARSSPARGHSRPPCYGRARGDDPARRGRPLLPRQARRVAAGASPRHVATASHAPDLVICDIARVEPEDVAEAWPDIPIVGYTNHTDTQGLRRAHTAGFDQVIVKSALVERATRLVDELVGSSLVRDEPGCNATSSSRPRPRC